ncbi:MAG: lysophospholipid acyltransferase family protein [Deltaproteobacteria bacterium]|nr:lysophospholipid acyltransferase family protein [Deltaproteobacteria bacterium]
MKSFLNASIYRFIYGIFYVLGLIPFKIRNLICYFIGTLWFYVDRRHRKVALKNMSRVYGDKKTDKEVLNLARSVFIELPKIIFEAGWSLRLKKDSLPNFFKVEGVENIDEAFKRGKGVLILTAHIGSWELLTLVPGMLPYKFHDIYRPLDFEPLRDFFDFFRSRFGMGLIGKRRAMREILKTLSDGEGIGVPLDQAGSRPEGVFVDFFGEPTSTNKSIARVAMKTGASVVPVFLVREKDKFRVFIDKIVETVDTGCKNDDVKVNTENYNKIIEKYIKKYPSQWFWVHDRWKHKLLENG